MFAAWLKFACALLCVLALALSGATGEAERIETASDAAPVKYTKSAKSGSALVVSARAGAGCPSAALAKPAPARPLPAPSWAAWSERDECLRASSAPVARRCLQSEFAEPRSRSGVVRLLI